MYVADANRRKAFASKGGSRALKHSRRQVTAAETAGVCSKCGQTSLATVCARCNRAAGASVAPEAAPKLAVSKPQDFQRNPGAVKALLLAAGLDASIIDAAPSPLTKSDSGGGFGVHNASSTTSGGGFATTTTATASTTATAASTSPARIRKALPQLPPQAAAARPSLCAQCHERPVAARVARRGRQLYLCKECTVGERERFRARGTISIGQSPMRRGPRPPDEPKAPKPPLAPKPEPLARPVGSAAAGGQYVELTLVPAAASDGPTAEQLAAEEAERERRASEQEAHMAAMRAAEQPGESNPDELEVIGRVRALYDFASEHESELALRAGDVVFLTCRVDDEWREGYIDDEHELRAGLFPTAYVEEIGWED